MNRTKLSLRYEEGRYIARLDEDSGAETEGYGDTIPEALRNLADGVEDGEADEAEDERVDRLAEESGYDNHLDTSYLEEDIRIEYPSRGATYCRDEYGVYKYDTYPPSSVLAGQTRRQFMGFFQTLEEAQADYPSAVVVKGSSYIPASLSHLPDGPDL